MINIDYLLIFIFIKGSERFHVQRSRSNISVHLQLDLLRQLYGISTTDSDRAYRQCCRAVVPWTAPGIDVQSIAKYRRADATRTVSAPQLQHHGQRQSSWTLQQRTSTLDSSKDPRVRPLINTVGLQHHGQRQHLNFSNTDSNITFRQC